MLARGVNPLNSRVLVMGLTFKENVEDIRNTKVIDVIRELKSFNVTVDVIDPFASSEEAKSEYDIDLIDAPASKSYNAIIVAVNHDNFTNLSEEEFKNLLVDGEGVFVDVKGVFRNKIESLEYWSL